MEARTFGAFYTAIRISMFLALALRGIIAVASTLIAGEGLLDQVRSQSQA